MRGVAMFQGYEAPVVISSAVQMPLGCEELARRVARRDAVLLASKLLAKIEQMNFMYAIDALQQIPALERLAVVKVMVTINRQHRTVIRSLPTLSVKTVMAGCTNYLYQLGVSYQNEDQEPTDLVFTFDLDELDGTVKISRSCSSSLCA